MLIFNQAAPPQDPNLTLEWFKALAPIAAGLLATVGVCLTIWWSMRKGREDARFAYASKALDLRLRQMMEFYAPLRLQIEQSRILYDKLKLSLEQLGEENPSAKIPLKGFRLVDHAYRILSEDQFKEVKPLVEGIIQTGDGISELIGKHGALAEGGITKTLINYRAHLLVLKAASKQPLKFNADDKSLESGYYYPNMLNREVTEGYKEVLRHFEVFQEVGDEVAWTLLGRVPASRRKDFTDLLENLQYYETNAEAYAAKFDAFDLSELRNHLHQRVSQTRGSGKLAEQPLLLEVGAGTGRDTTAFIRSGYRVTAFDISPAMVRLCNRRIREERNNPSPDIAEAAKNSSCIEMSFDEVNFRNQFDAAWASASLLHVPKKDLQAVIQRLVRALKQNGILFISFKFGEGEAEFDSRHYSYFKPDEIRRLVNQVPLTQIDEVWLSDKEGKRLSKWAEWSVLGGLNEKVASGCWVNVLIQKRRT